MADRPGGKAGTFGVASAQQEAVDRKERLRKLALETFDLDKDPYVFRNRVGQYECKLCLTVHPNEGNYLAHTQGKRHQESLARRAAREAKDKAVLPAPAAPAASVAKRGVRIGRPGYRVLKQKDPETAQRSLQFEIDYPEIEEGLQPRHRFMSAYEQKVEAPDRAWQYVLFAASPYETIAFKIPSLEVDRDPAKFHTSWDAEKKVFTLQLHFKAERKPGSSGAGAADSSSSAGSASTSMDVR
jgi:splicing factor 3A subunit 2